LAVVLGLAAYIVSRTHEAVDALVVGIILGMIVRTIVGDRARFLPGLALAPKIFIPLGVIFYGINLKFNRLTEVSGVVWIQLLAATVLVFVVAVYLGRRLRMREPNSLLMGIGTAICGASAIAVATSVVDADSEDAGSSLITITIFGLFGMILCPLTIAYFHFDETRYAVLCATTLHMTGIVKSAAAAFGEGCLRLALSIKMARTALIIPVLGYLLWRSGRGSVRTKRSIVKRIPWFLWAFVGVGLAMSFVPGAARLTPALRPWAGIFFTIALTSIGLTVDLKRMINAGGAPLVLGLACWLVVIALFVLTFPFLR